MQDFLLFLTSDFYHLSGGLPASSGEKISVMDAVIPFSEEEAWANNLECFAQRLGSGTRLRALFTSLQWTADISSLSLNVRRPRSVKLLPSGSMLVDILSRRFLSSS